MAGQGNQRTYQYNAFKGGARNIGKGLKGMAAAAGATFRNVRNINPKDMTTFRMNNYYNKVQFRDSFNNFINGVGGVAIGAGRWFINGVKAAGAGIQTGIRRFGNATVRFSRYIWHGIRGFLARIVDAVDRARYRVNETYKDMARAFTRRNILPTRKAKARYEERLNRNVKLMKAGTLALAGYGVTSIANAISNATSKEDKE